MSLNRAEGHRRRQLRVTVTRKIMLSLAIILFIGMASMLFIYNGLHTVVRIVHKLATQAEPTSAAAYEMEVNINEGGQEAKRVRRPARSRRAGCFVGVCAVA